MGGLLIEPISTKAERVTDLPAFVWSSALTGRYAHRPRSAQRFGNRLCVQMWCGQHLQQPGAGPEVPPSLEGVCGTCEGRWLAQHASSRLQFGPRSWFELTGRRWCPGPRYGLWVPNGPDYRHALCALCGYAGHVYARRGWNAYGVQMERHEPMLRDLAIVHCPAHGYRDLRGHRSRTGATVLKCISWQCDFEAVVP